MEYFACIPGTAVFRGSILLILWVPGSISDVCAWGTAYTRSFLLLELPIFAVFRPSVLLILPVLGSISFISTGNTPEYSQYQILQILGVQYCSYSRYSAVSRSSVLAILRALAEYQIHKILGVCSGYEIHWEHLWKAVFTTEIAFHFGFV